MIETESKNNLIHETLRDPSNLLNENEIQEQISIACKVFDIADENQTESINKVEAVRLFEELGIFDDVNVHLEQIDIDGSDEIDRLEWVNWWIKRVSRSPNPVKQQQAIARSIFKKYDLDHSGILDIKEIYNVFDVLGAAMTDDEISVVINELDLNGNGEYCHFIYIVWLICSRLGRM